LLNGREIPSSSVGGELHTARGYVGNCVKCSEQIVAGQPYVKIFTYNGEPLHLECWLIDHDMTIVAVGRRKSMSGPVIVCESEVELAKRLIK
jgi:hypothetical protein